MSGGLLETFYFIEDFFRFGVFGVTRASIDLRKLVGLRKQFFISGLQFFFRDFVTARDPAGQVLGDWILEVGRIERTHPRLELLPESRVVGLIGSRIGDI